MITGEVPFANLRVDGAVILAVKEKQRPPRPTMTAHRVSDAMWQLWEECWAEAPDDRPKMAEVLVRLSRLS